ncbi:MAG: metallophosphoesterase [Deltaproteobacteria bacterium]|jgi:hypothetical protein|nr:metallophosphoesterase [Deltaproteobacteria bacterium]
MAHRAKLLRLPGHGKLLVSADLHGNYRDFLTIAHRFERLGEDAHLLFLGDLVHGPYLPLSQWPQGAPPGHPLAGRPYCDESPAVLLGVQLLLSRYPGRVHVLLGNHEHAHIGGPRTALFARDEATALEQRIGIEASLHMASFFRSLPIVAWAPCGLFFSHAAPACELVRIEDMEGIDYRRYIAPRRTDKPRTAKSNKPGELAARLLGQLLWEHVLPPFKAQSLLARVGAQVAVYGHTIIPTGYQAIGYEQLILSTSFGMHDQHKTLLLLDLDEHYLSVDSIRPGIELLPLYER